MALSPIEDSYLQRLTSSQFPDMPASEPAMPVDAAALDAPSMDGMQLAAGPSQTVSDAGPSIGPIPRNTFQTAVGKLGELIQSGAEKIDFDVIGLPGIGSMTLKDLTVGDLGKVLQDMSYGFMPVRGGNVATGGIGTFGLKADPAMELLNAAPAVVSVAKGAVKAAKATKGMPVGMSTQAVGGMDGVLTPQLAIERVPGVKPGDELIVQHNLTASNLLKADKMGGLPVPSLAISKADMPLENFGEITLIAPKEMAVPSAKNPVFGADAYTARFPKIDYQIDTKSKKSLRGLVADVIDKLPGGDYNFDRLMNDWNDRQYNQVLRAKFLDERGELPNPKDFDESWKFDSAVSQLVRDNQGEFQDWLTKFDDSLADAGVNVKERIFKGFTYAGDRRYAAATLDNIVKEMKGGAGGEGFNYGVGNLRAVATPKFRTLSQIKAARGKVVDQGKMEEIKKQTDDAYFEILQRLREVNKDYSAEDALLEFAQSKRMSTLDRLYDNKLPDELKADIGIFLNKIQELPTGYFEIKPQRAVSIEEFRGAIIPVDTPESARAVLRKAGITDVYEYSTPEERKSLFQKYGKEMFAAMPAVPAGTATMQDKEQK